MNNHQKTYNLAIVGATGAVGQKTLEILENKELPINELKLLSSPRSAGTVITFKNKDIVVEEATSDSFIGVDIALFSAGGAITERLAQDAIDHGAVVIDNTSAFRMDADVPLVVPEVNSDHMKNHKNIIANPNCSTIQMVVALNPIKDKFGLSKIVVSTYQSVSGAGLEAIDELHNQNKQYVSGEEMTAERLPVGSADKHYPIAFNALPQIDEFDENGFTKEEMKMINETKKILDSPDLNVAATCVRLPIIQSHAESVYIEVDQAGVTVEDLWNVLKDAPGVILQDDPLTQTYPTPLEATDKEEVFVGRVRKDLDNDKGFHLWIVSDNLVKGASLNTIQIMESLIENNYL